MSIPIQKNDHVTMGITALGSEGQGIGKLNGGYTVFVSGALPGETIDAHIIKVGRNFGFARIEGILTPSPNRVTPTCILNGKCGGCVLQHFAYDAQLAYKREVVSDALKRIGGFSDIQVEPVLGMEEPYFYRNKASFPIAQGAHGVEIGFYAPRSHRVVPIEDCVLQTEKSLFMVLQVRNWANAFRISVYNEESGKGLLRHIVTRTTSLGECMATIVAAGSIPHTDALVDYLKDVGGLKSVYLNINAETTNVIHGERFIRLYGEAHIQEELMHLQFEVSPASFLQVNKTQTEKLYAKVLEALALSGDENLVDAYCGIGTITLMLARHSKQIVGIEDVAQAIEDAKRNAVRNGITNARFICGAAEKELPMLIKSRYPMDALVLDPPRKGADTAFLHAIRECGIKKVVYVSCNPGTLARDLKILCEQGRYAVKHVMPVDMFPQTPHVETVAVVEYSV